MGRARHRGTIGDGVGKIGEDVEGGSGCSGSDEGVKVRWWCGCFAYRRQSSRRGDRAHTWTPARVPPHAYARAHTQAPQRGRQCRGVSQGAHGVSVCPLAPFGATTDQRGAGLPRCPTVSGLGRELSAPRPAMSRLIHAATSEPLRMPGIAVPDSAPISAAPSCGTTNFRARHDVGPGEGIAR